MFLVKLIEKLHSANFLPSSRQYLLLPLSYFPFPLFSFLYPLSSFPRTYSFTPTQSNDPPTGNDVPFLIKLLSMSQILVSSALINRGCRNSLPLVFCSVVPNRHLSLDTAIIGRRNETKDVRRSTRNPAFSTFSASSFLE